MELFRQLDNRQTDGQTNGQLVYRQTDKQTDKQTDGRTLLVPKVAIATEKLRKY